MSRHWFGNALYAVASRRFLRAVVYPALWFDPRENINRYAIAGEGAARLMARRLTRTLKRRLLARVNSLETFCGVLLPFERSAMRGNELFRKAFDLARQPGCRTVLIVGASGGAGLTEACLAGVRENPSAPVACCVNRSTFRFAELRRRYRRDPRLCFRTLVAGGDHGRIDGAVASLMREKAIDGFDLAVFDASAFGEDAALGAAHRAKAVLVDGANTAQGYRHVRDVLAYGTYAVTAQDIQSPKGYIVLQAE